VSDISGKIRAALIRLKGGPQQSFSGRAGVIFIGTALGQGFSFILLPLTARIYGPETLGSAASVLAILGIASLLTSLQYDNAIIVASDHDVPYLLLLSSAITCAWTLILSVVIFFDLLLDKGQFLVAKGVGWTLPALIFTYSHFILLVNYRLRQNELYRVSLGRIIYYGGTAILQVVGGFFFGGQASIFLLAQVLGAFISVLYLLPWSRAVRVLKKKKIKIRLIKTEIPAIARAYANFPKFQMPGGVLNAVSVHLPIIFMKAVFSEAWAGWYFVAWRILAAPTVLISQAIGQVFYRDSAERERSGVEQGRILEKIVFNLFRVSFIPAVALGVTAPLLVSGILGEEWSPVSTILRVLLVSMQVTFFTSPVSQFLNVKGRQAGFMAFCTALLLARSTALAIGWGFRSEILSVVAYSLASVAVLMLFLAYIVKSAGGSMRRIARNSAPLVLDMMMIGGILSILWSLDLIYKPQGIAVALALLSSAVWREKRRHDRQPRGHDSRPLGAD
jgi:O-antigen/teichoic acid export membrane protein